MGIKESPVITDDEAAEQQFQKTIKWTGDRYEVRLPWKELDYPIADNFKLSVRRLKTTSNKLRRDPKLYSKYAKILREQEELGIIEAVQIESPAEGYLNYLPHKPVVTPNKQTTKVRIVYDASAHSRRCQKKHK